MPTCRDVLALVCVAAVATGSLDRSATAAADQVAPAPFGAEFAHLDDWATGDWQKSAAAAAPRKPGSEEARPFDLRVPRREVIAFSLYTVTVRPDSRGTLKLSAQLFPLEPGDPREARLEIKRGDAWVETARGDVHEPGWDVNFRVEDWDSSRDWPYRVRHGADAVFEGLVRRDPAEKPEIVVAVMSYNSSRTPGEREELVAGLRKADPDLLFFAGDQTYRHTQHTVGWIEFGLQFRATTSPTLPTIPRASTSRDWNSWARGNWPGSRRGAGTGRACAERRHSRPPPSAVPSTCMAAPTIA